MQRYRCIYVKFVGSELLGGQLNQGVGVACYTVARLFGRMGVNE